MTKPTVLQNIILALAIAVGGGLLFHLLTPVFGFILSGRILLPLVFGSYVIYLLHHSPLRNGKLSAFALWAGGAALVFWFDGGTLLSAALHGLGLWLLRSIFFRRNLLGAAAEIAPLGASSVGALWTLLHTGSVGLALWCFFLGQSLFVLLPDYCRRKRRGTAAAPTGTATFERAHSTALAALNQLYRNPARH